MNIVNKINYDKIVNFDKDMAWNSRIAGTIVIFDIVDSTKLKIKKEFPNWIEDYIPFYEIVARPFIEKNIWYKFLGDAFFFFIPDEAGFNKDKTFLIKFGRLPHNEIYNLCKRVMDEFWNKYKPFKDKSKRGGKKHDNFREVTCAIDYGSDVFNWFHLLKEAEDEEPAFDPIGKTIDRGFRFSALAGAGQIVVSSFFYEKLVSDDPALANKFLKIHVKENTLKGFPNITDVYYNRPNDEKIDYYLDDTNVELIENAKPMDIKAKLKLFREKISREENDNENL